MLRRNKPSVGSLEFMDSSLIGQLEVTEEDKQLSDFTVRAVLFGAGQMRRLGSDAEVYGLILAGYHGFRFGDDGTTTGMLASELLLNADGIEAAERSVNEALIAADVAYYAEYVERITAEEAAALLDVRVKIQHGIEVPHDTYWDGGQYSYSVPAPVQG